MLIEKVLSSVPAINYNYNEFKCDFTNKNTFFEIIDSLNNLTYDDNLLPVDEISDYLVEDQKALLNINNYINVLNKLYKNIEFNINSFDYDFNIPRFNEIFQTIIQYFYKQV